MNEPDNDQIRQLAALIRKVDGRNFLGAAALAEAILSHRDCPLRAPRPIPITERLPKPYDPSVTGLQDCDPQGRCWWLKQRANPEHDLLSPTWHLQRSGPAGSTFFRFTHWLPHWALPLPEVKS